jgi:hypothetical protein
MTTPLGRVRSDRADHAPNQAVGQQATSVTLPVAGLRAAYSLAAVAAAGSAEAAIIYSGPQNIAIGQGFAQALLIDGDEYPDITLKNYSFINGPYQGATVDFYPGKLVAFPIAGTPYPTWYVTALDAGFLVDSAAVSFFTGSMAYGAANPNAQFNDATGKFIGLQFPSGGDNYFAWIRVNVNNEAGTFTIVDWAYDSSGAPIVVGAVPEPSTLGLLAAGAAGVAALRRRRRS